MLEGRRRTTATATSPESHFVRPTLYDFNNLEQRNNGCQVVPEER